MIRRTRRRTRGRRARRRACEPRSSKMRSSRLASSRLFGRPPLAQNFVAHHNLPDDLRAPLRLVGLREQRLCLRAAVPLAEVLREVAHEYDALLDGAYGAPKRLLSLLRELGEQRVDGVSVARVAAEAQVAPLLQLKQHAVALRARVDGRLAPLQYAALKRV